jgi:hypothetical protein
MIVRELLTLLGFTVDKGSYNQAVRAYDALQGKMLQQQHASQQAALAQQKQAQAASQAARGTGLLGQALGMMQRFGAQAQLSGMLTQFTQMASSADETRNVIKQLFGDEGLAQVTDWSTKMGAAMGRSKYSLQQYASTLGAVIQPMAKSDKEAQAMATSLAELSVDLASFFNTSDEDAMRALRSGLTGEYESLKRYGVVLNDTTLQEVANQRGIKKKVSQMTAAEKTELRYAAIMKRTERVKGDAIRTGEGFANATRAMKDAMRDLGTDMGATVLPKVEMLIRLTRDALNWFNQMRGSTHILEAAMYTLAGVAGILALEFYGAFVLPAIAIGALILLIDDLWTTLDGGESVTRDIIDGLWGIGTTADIVATLKEALAGVNAELAGLDLHAIWDTWANGADNLGFAIQRTIEKIYDFFNVAKKLRGLARWVGFDVGQEEAEGRTTERGPGAPLAESTSEEIRLRQRDQTAAVGAGLAERNENRRFAKYGARTWSMEQEAAQAAQPMIPFAAGLTSAAAPMASAPAAAGAGAAGGAAPAVNLAAPTIIINGGDEARVKRVVTETMEAERKKTAAALGRRGRS